MENFLSTFRHKKDGVNMGQLQIQQRFPNGVRQFVKEMLAAKPESKSIYSILPLFDKYYHHQRNVVDKAKSFAVNLNGSNDGKMLRMAIEVYELAIVKRVFDASPPPLPVINELMR